jgi:lactoylglutathione lyase
MSIEHVGLWVDDLERELAFYTGLLGGTAGDLYENPATGLRSYFVSFNGGARLELMNRSGAGARRGVAFQQPPSIGYAHVAFQLGRPDAVDALVALLALNGATVESAPRMTGDGYYEAVVLDPEGNRIELMA